MNIETALSMVKSRLNRLADDTTIDNYLTHLIAAAVEKLNSMMPFPLQAESLDDMMLLVEYAVFQYQSRDKAGGEPEWLRLLLRERYLKRG